MILPWKRQDIPICAGILLTHQSKVLLTLATRHKWITTDDKFNIPVTGVSGGQEIGETMLECAQREAREEILCEVQLLHSDITYVEREPGVTQIEQYSEEPAPLIYHVQPRFSPEPYAPGLPFGDQLHVGIFRALPKAQPQPGDVPGLLWVPLNILSVLAKGVTVGQLDDLGIELNSTLSIPKSVSLFIPRSSTEALLVRIIESFGPEAVQV